MAALFAMKASTIRPARKERLGEIIYGQILEQILADNYGEGDKLPSEAELSLAFEVSRPVIREALMRLQADGLVQARRGIGTFVSHRPSSRLPELVSATELSGYLRTFEPRIVLEAEAARLAASRRTNHQLKRMRDTIEALRAAIQGGHLGTEEDIAFHEVIAEATGNDYFPSLLNDLRRPVVSTMAIGLELARERSPARRNRVVEEHGKVFDAVLAQDGECAAAYMRHHLYQARAAVTDVHHLEREPFNAPNHPLDEAGDGSVHHPGEKLARTRRP
ncbi:GntR family transcriptional regulator [Chelatococcus asaccharovorans]|uniref:GntR family transcriptional regulator n=2 Tax=Chelatococcus asaccharovorans TaxID=28210 RepID=A0A2V3UET7_9HYPH|nr:GntR family transcriptional regulator [Chelatococcus asaccharovorans]CAH1650479.1 GntR family transcriptional regulator [Chelatococcus asaccharovorans]CAH1692313.1 GntR family transcriptional regulator [Chelatococcus asaccharovorans]